MRQKPVLQPSFIAESIWKLFFTFLACDQGVFRFSVRKAEGK